MNEEVTPLSSRKSDHIRINLEEDTQSGITTGLENYHFIHHALPEMDLSEVDSGQQLFGKKISSPILISSMTGGTDEAARLNQVLATAAEETQIAMGVGSQRIAIDQPELSKTFQVRQFAPTILLFANLGAVQLNFGYGLDECKRAVEIIGADALVLHFNSLQEAIQKEGQPIFSGLCKKVELICKSLHVPVIAKEVGWGFSKQDAALLAGAGISAIDVAGAGGTSWSQVEMYRADTDHQRNLARVFRDWGISTSESIKNVVDATPKMIVLASGGLRSGLDIAKCVALGASLGGMAGPFLKSAAQSTEETIKTITLFKEQINICMFATGSKNLPQLRDNKLVRT